MDTHGATCVAGTVSGCGLNVLPVPASSTLETDCAVFVGSSCVFREHLALRQHGQGEDEHRVQ